MRMTSTGKGRFLCEVPVERRDDLGYKHLVRTFARSQRQIRQRVDRLAFGEERTHDACRIRLRKKGPVAFLAHALEEDRYISPQPDRDGVRAAALPRLFAHECAAA